MIFIDLNTEMSADISNEHHPAFVAAVNRRIAKYETEQLEEGKSAYVFITNMTYHRDLLGPAKMFSILTSVGISDFARARRYRMSEKYRRDQKHADALRVGESMKNLLSFPTTFDGSLPGSTLHGEAPPVQINEKYSFEGVGPDGSDVIGEVTDAIVDETAKESIIAIYTEDQQAHILKTPMSEYQLADYRAHKEAYFGKIKYIPNGIKNPYDLFLFFLEGQTGTKREKLLEQMKMTEDQTRGISNEDLLLEYCERLVSGSGWFKVVDGVMTDEPSESCP